ncbi:MAG: hypothetical protein BRC33_03780 [Cyanobacteria bacterium SW_9_44_58]|nr:MAG: hypothetical protein BRC33_03780 [Cyanobacteria bacterium SW_9_44_58]
MKSSQEKTEKATDYAVDTIKVVIGTTSTTLTFTAIYVGNIDNIDGLTLLITSWSCYFLSTVLGVTTLLSIVTEFSKQDYNQLNNNYYQASIQKANQIHTTTSNQSGGSLEKVPLIYQINTRQAQFHFILFLIGFLCTIIFFILNSVNIFESFSLSEFLNVVLFQEMGFNKFFILSVMYLLIGFMVGVFSMICFYQKKIGIFPSITGNKKDK